jgi:hypothetical protein
VFFAAEGAQASRRGRRPAAPRRMPQAPVSDFVEEESDPRPLRIDLDFAMGESTVRFVTGQEFAGVCQPDQFCSPPPMEYLTLRGTAALAWKGVAFEGGIAMGLLQGEQPKYFVWRAGVRLETGWKSLFSLMFRIQWVYRAGYLEGMGGSASTGIVIRPTEWLALYGEAAIDMLSVPKWASNVGAIFSYTPIFTGGMRFQFGV